MTAPDDRAYQSAILALIAPARAAVEDVIVPGIDALLAAVPEALKVDEKKTIAEMTDDLVGKARESFYGRAKRLDELAAKAAARAMAGAADHNRRQLARELTVDPFGSEPWLRDFLAEAVRQNVSLIKSIPEDYFRQIEGLVSTAVRRGLRHEEIAKAILGRYEGPGLDLRPDLWAKAKARAKLLARDQVAKANSDVSRIRQQSIGLTEYVWRASLDERVRPEHRARDGKIFAWSDPPADGHPGQPVQCRCIAEPLIPPPA